MRRFVIVVDMQRDFVAADGALPVGGAEAIVVPMRAWLAELKTEDVAGVLFTADTHEPEIYAGSPEAKEFPPHCEKGTPGWELVIDPGAVDPAIPVYILEKGVFDMWRESSLAIKRTDRDQAIDRETFFIGLKEQGVYEVMVVGVASDYCVRWAVEGLIARGFRVVVSVAMTRGIARQTDQILTEDGAI